MRNLEELSKMLNEDQKKLLRAALSEIRADVYQWIGTIETKARSDAGYEKARLGSVSGYLKGKVNMAERIKDGLHIRLGLLDSKVK